MESPSSIGQLYSRLILCVYKSLISACGYQFGVLHRCHLLRVFSVIFSFDFIIICITVLDGNDFDLSAFKNPIFFV